MKTFFKPWKTAVMVASAFALLTACETHENVLESGPDMPKPHEVTLAADMDTATYKVLLAQAWSAVRETHGSAGKANYLSRTFTVSYSDRVTLHAGGVTYADGRGEWLAGTASGSGTMPPAVFAALDASAARHIRLEVYDSWFFLRPVRLTLLDKGGATTDGLYNAVTGEFLFLGVGGAGTGTLGSTPCGFVSLASLYGKLRPDGSQINNGLFSLGFVLACETPIVVGASVDFGYTALMAF